MVLLQPKLSLKVAQRQILTPGLMQMVSVLALNKLELKEMIQAEIAENPVLEELEENVPLLDDVARAEEDRDRPVETQPVTEGEKKEKDPFDEIDFGSYFQDYLDPGFRSPNNYEEIEKPSIENFLSAPMTLTDHLIWQLGSLSLSPAVREAAEYIIGNLNEDGYLTATDEELLAGYLREQMEPDTGDASKNVYSRVAELPPAMAERARGHLATALDVVRQLDPIGVGTRDLRECLLVQVEAQRKEFELIFERTVGARRHKSAPRPVAAEPPAEPHPAAIPQPAPESNGLNGTGAGYPTHFAAHPAANGNGAKPEGPHSEENTRLLIFELAKQIIDTHMLLLQKRDPRELSKVCGKSVEETQRAIDFIRTLDPRPGQRYNRCEARLIEPDVAFVKRGDEWVVAMNEEDLPTLRLNQGYRRLLTPGRHGEGRKRLRQGALPLRIAADAQHRAAQEHDSAHLRSDRAPPGGVSGKGRRRAEADDDQGSRGGDRRASIHGEPRRLQQIRAYAAGRLRAALLLHRGRERPEGRARR